MLRKFINESAPPQSLLSFSIGRTVPLLTQSEMSECGLACLSMISSYYGYKIDIVSLRTRISLSGQGMSLNDIMELGNRLDLASRAVKCELNELGYLTLPCILHWDLDHFVVLTKVNKQYVFINDPAIGKRKIRLSEASQSFTGVALELTPSSAFKKQNSQVKMKLSQLWERIEGLKRSLTSLLLLSVIIQFTALISPYYMQWVVDSVLLSGDKPLLLVLTIGFSLLLLIQVAVNALRSWLILKLNNTVSLQMGANLFHHLLRLPIRFFENRHIGDIVSRFGSMSTIREMLTTGVVESFIDGIMATVVLIMMFLYNIKLTLLVLSFVSTSYLVRLVFYFPNRNLTGEVIRTSAQENSTFLETIRAIQTIKLFSNETERQNMWLNRFADVINAEIRQGRLQIAENTLNKLLFGLESIFVTYLGATAVMNNQLTVGMLLAFIAYKMQFTSSISRFIGKIFSYKLLDLHFERLSDIVLADRENVSSRTMIPESLLGHIRFESVSFRYAENLNWVLKDISFEVMPGECIALVGTSGTGKTTLMKLLLRVLEPNEGNIYLDGININEMSLTDYRRRFGTVMQDDVLLTGTLRENITMFESNYDQERLHKSCQQAHILDEINALPMGFHSLVGDMGNCFSGGQLQRIFLARALYKQPQILCLDEATSHLDSDNENRINHNICRLKMTRIIIAHRHETIAMSDRTIQI
ncbi:peptidase domain-containing ABC transporter [Vibrio mediterranei]|uniref:peptidase domain-containing ABC transporter n=1 Tax=Vibrio mediterranei TaxID=689 RepID=UPI001EFE388E|nr:peptidase domain-containing ABC transporter [Vibrio mediterranei]MCG9660526.1 peptidase domain-containing ABC transporter [Vibrio mediterranei]